MPSLFENSIFYEIVFSRKNERVRPTAILGGVSCSRFNPDDAFSKIPIVVFDFETTGLDTQTARIIEIGAIRYENRKEVARISQLINPGTTLPPETFSLTGINDDMLAGKPTIDKVLPDLHDFLRGCIGVAHNAEFDAGVLLSESARLGIHCSYHMLCTVKMARQLIKEPLVNRKLDTLAAHFGLTFEARHRSIGDILVTAEILWKMVQANPALQLLRDFEPFRHVMPELALK